MFIHVIELCSVEGFFIIMLGLEVKQGCFPFHFPPPLSSGGQKMKFINHLVKQAGNVCEGVFHLDGSDVTC